MEFIKENWKTILIVLLAIMFVSKCSSSGNYKRKLAKSEARVEYVTDSLMDVYTNAAAHIDSLNHIIKLDEVKIDALESQLSLSKEQNRQLATKKDNITVTIKEKAEEK